MPKPEGMLLLTELSHVWNGMSEWCLLNAKALYRTINKTCQPWRYQKTSLN